MHIKKGDNVIVLSGEDKGKTGKVLSVFPKLEKAVVEGVRLVKKHERARKNGQKGQIIEVNLPIYTSKLAKVEDVKKKTKKK